MSRKSALMFVAALFCGNAQAFQVFVGRVSLLQPTYLPSLVSFQLTSGTDVCPAGGWLQYTNPDHSLNKTVYTTLLAASVAGKPVRLYINDGDTTCTVVFVHLLE